MSNLYRIGVGIMMLNTKNQIFVAERKYPKNAWQMPQGGIELNESPKDAVFREAMEEIGTNNFNIIAVSELEKIIVNFKREMYRKVVSEFKSLILTKLNETF